MNALRRYAPQFQSRVYQRCFWCGRHLAVVCRSLWYFRNKPGMYGLRTFNLCSVHCETEYEQEALSWQRTKRLEDLLPVVEAFPDGNPTAADIALAYKAAFQDFVRGKTNRKSFEAVSRHLTGMLNARKQQLAEDNSLSAQRCYQFYAN